MINVPIPTQQKLIKIQVTIPIILTTYSQYKRINRNTFSISNKQMRKVVFQFRNNIQIDTLKLRRMECYKRILM